jgi:uncharacterized damage-inducible protein DinB
MADEREFLRDQLVRAMEGGAWHGSSLAELVAGVTAAEAMARPIAGAHTITELVLHLAAWTDEVAARLGGSTPQEPEAGDWPPVSGEAAVAWEQARQALGGAHARLLAALEACAPADLDRRVGSAEVPALGTGHTVRGMLHGLAQHHGYHGGQIALLTRAVRAQPG